jgi:hypothetical protein
MLKHASICTYDIKLFTFDLFLAFIVIAWKFNETTPLIVRHFVQCVYSEDTDKMGLDWLKKKLAYIVHLEC